MSRFFNDMDIRNMTPKEHDAVMTILRSDRAAVLTKFLVEEFANLDESAPTYLFKILTVVVQKMMANVGAGITGTSGTVPYANKSGNPYKNYNQGTTMQITQWDDTTRTEVFRLLDILFNQGIYVTMEHCFWDESVKNYRDKDGNCIDKVKLGFLKRFWYIGISTKEYYVIHSHFGEHGLQVVNDRTDFKSMDEMIQYIYSIFN